MIRGECKIYLFIYLFFFGGGGFWLIQLHMCPELLCGICCNHSWGQTIPLVLVQYNTSGHHYKSGPMIILKNLTLKQTHLSFFGEGDHIRHTDCPGCVDVYFSDESKVKVKLILKSVLRLVTCLR